MLQDRDPVLEIRGREKCQKKKIAVTRPTYLVSRVIASHVTFTTVDAHLFIYQSLDLRTWGRDVYDIFMLSVTFYMNKRQFNQHTETHRHIQSGSSATL